jgi:hypothetical protein
MHLRGNQQGSCCHLLHQTGQLIEERVDPSDNRGSVDPQYTLEEQILGVLSAASQPASLTELQTLEGQSTGNMRRVMARGR